MWICFFSFKEVVHSCDKPIDGLKATAIDLAAADELGDTFAASILVETTQQHITANAP